jgi:hypothetical protein
MSFISDALSQNHWDEMQFAIRLNAKLNVIR